MGFIFDRLLKAFAACVVMFAIWLPIDLDFDARDPDSLERMMRWSPFSAAR
jgi:hypothetical protein